jgi:two-component system cell cycle sensor histidine kinase/response regulator CckA
VPRSSPTPHQESASQRDASGVDLLDLHRHLVEAVDDYAIYALDPDGVVLSWNAGARRLKGFDDADIIGRNYATLFPPAAVAAGEPVAQLRAAAARGRFESEGWRIRKDGTRFWAHVVMHARRRDGALIGFAKVTRDLSERRRIELALRESEERFRIAFDHAAIGMAITALDGRWLRVNRALAATLGYTQEELLALTVQAITHPDDLPQTVDLMKRAVNGELDRYQLEKRYICKDGRTAWIALNVVRASDAAGGQPYFLAQMEDITARRSAVEALASSEARFRSLCASSPLGIFRSDAEGSVTYANPRVLQIFGLSESEGLGHGWLARVHPEDAPDVVVGWRESLAAGRDYAREYRLLMADGAVRWVRCQAAPLLDRSGTLIGTVGTIDDITERRALESQLRQASKMEAVGRLAGGVAHDFNNLLTVISANTAFVAADLPASSQAAMDLAQVEEATRRAAALTRQLLAFSRKQVLRPRRVDLNETVRELERMLRRLIGEQVSIHTRLDPQVWPVNADPSQLEQVLMNLVVNARDAMPDGGVVRIATANVELDEAHVALCAGMRAGHYVSLTVADDGVGIPPALVPHVFEPFFTTKELGKGTGLGLATVYGIVKQSAGHVTVESEMGKGTTFTVLLPRHDALPSAPLEGAGSLRGGNETVLLVEDEVAVRAALRRMLTRHGYRVLQAGDGAEALRVWTAARVRGTVDIVLVDAVMPVLSGQELIAALRAEQPDAKVVLMTGYTHDMAEVTAALTRGGASGFLQKPIAEEALLEQVRRVLDQPRAAAG